MILAMYLSVTQPRPDREMNNAFGYLLAVYAAKYGIRVHAACVQSTHWHAVLSDPYGLLPAFLRDFNRGLANFIKALRGWRGTVFQAHPNVVQLLTSEAIVDKIGYTLANPVARSNPTRSGGPPGLRRRPPRPRSSNYLKTRNARQE